MNSQSALKIHLQDAYEATIAISGIAKVLSMTDGDDCPKELKNGYVVSCLHFGIKSLAAFLDIKMERIANMTEFEL